MDQKENLIDKELSLTVVLPGGVEKTTIVHGSKPLMDLLVTLCAKYHLSPSSHTLELVTSNRNNIKLKPNALIGTLAAEKIILKPKGEDKNKKTGPQMPEATVRMVINYKKTQKTILRVNPRVPLAELLPAICEKCEFDVESTVLLKDVQSLTPLDLSSSLNDYAIREVYARDTKAQPATPDSPGSPIYAGTVTPGKEKTQKERENKGLFGTFRRKSKKKSEQPTTASAPASPVLVSKPRPLSMALPSSNSSPLGSPTISADAPKKRRAPQPPVLVSQSCTSDPSTRRRLHSEPTGRLDSDQVCGVSRGSSAESSLRRTKRKAPPPPSPSAAVQEPVFPDENLQAGDDAQRLEEIREQEEMTASVMSATANNAQGEDGSLSRSRDVSLRSPSPDFEMASTVSAEGSGEDQSHDLSSDGNQQQSTLNDSITSSVRKADDADSSDLADTNCVPLQVANVSPHPICHESAAHGVEAACSVAASSIPPPAMQDAEAQASLQVTAESLREPTNRSENPVATGTSCPTGEDAQVQTDFTQLPAPPTQHVDNGSSPAVFPACESPGKKDMATLTEDLGPSTSETSSHQESIPSALATAKGPPMYATDSEPKPKPSNELTRDYIPKVGMTTYTIVPQKSLEKLRYFEVALTLETPTEASRQVLDTGSPHSDESTRQPEQMEVSKEKRELPSTLRREDELTSTTTNQHTVNGSIPESTVLSSPTRLCNADGLPSSADGASPAGSPAEAKEMKIPPATKPKPASFRLSQHKKTPGYYVTSAAEKTLKEAQGSAERTDLPPPPPPPPVEYEEVTTGATNAQLSPKQLDKNVPSMRMTRQSSLPARDPSVGLSLEKLRSFAAPRPYSPATPSRFAQAVSSAVKRSQSVSYRSTSPHLSPPVSPITRHPPATESQRLSKLQDGELDHDGSASQREEGEAASFSETLEMDEAGP